MEISDIIFSTVGPAAGAVVVEWNVKECSQGGAGMWNSHIRYNLTFSGLRYLVDMIVRTDWVVQTVPTSSLLTVLWGQFRRSAWLHSSLCTSPVRRQLILRSVCSLVSHCKASSPTCNAIGNLGLVSRPRSRW